MQVLDTEIVKRNFSKAAVSYESTARLQIAAAKELITRIGRFEGLTLDIGAGPGLIGKNCDLSFVEMDLSFKMCKLCGDLKVNGDFHNLPFKDAAFDNIVSSLSLQWANDLGVVLQEIYRALKVGGRLAFSTLGPDSLKTLRDAFGYMDSFEHLLQFDPAIKLFARLKKAGFKNLVISKQNISYNFPDIFAALKSIKNIGAGYNFSPTGGLKSKSFFEKLENVYKNLSENKDSIVLKWQVFYVSGQKSG